MDDTVKYKEENLLEVAWGIIANVGDWERQSVDWQIAAASFRNKYHNTLDSSLTKEVEDEEVLQYAREMFGLVTSKVCCDSTTNSPDAVEKNELRATVSVEYRVPHWFDDKIKSLIELGRDFEVKSLKQFVVACYSNQHCPDCGCDAERLGSWGNLYEEESCKHFETIMEEVENSKENPTSFNDSYLAGCNEIDFLGGKMWLPGKKVDVQQKVVGKRMSDEEFFKELRDGV